MTAARHAEVKRRYARHAREKRGPFTLANKRAAELRRLFSARGYSQQRIAATMAALGDLSKVSAGDLGDHIALTLAERVELRITTIRACDVELREARAFYKQRKRERDRERARNKRAAKGATPRADSLISTKPWEAEAISRRTWERRRQRDANSSPHEKQRKQPKQQPLRVDANSSPRLLSSVERRIYDTNAEAPIRPPSSIDRRIQRLLLKRGRNSNARRLREGYT